MLAVNMPSSSSRIIYSALRKVLPITTTRFSSKSYKTECVEEPLPESYSAATPVIAQSTASHTPIPSGRSMRCTNCSAQGHYSFECPLPSKYFQDEDSAKDESTISSEGVTFVYPEEKNKTDNKASIRCTNCSAIGHYSFECDQPEKCKHCQSTNHFHAHCPERPTEPTTVNCSFPPLDEQAIIQPASYHTKTLEEVKKNVHINYSTHWDKYKKSEKQWQPSWKPQIENNHGCDTETRSPPPQQDFCQNGLSTNIQKGWGQQQEEAIGKIIILKTKLTEMLPATKKPQNFNRRSNYEKADVHSSYGYNEGTRFSPSQQGPHQKSFQPKSQNYEQRTIEDKNKEAQKYDLPGTSSNTKSELRRFHAKSYVNNVSSVLYSQRLKDGKVQLCMRISSDTRWLLVGQHEEGLREIEKKFDNLATLHVLDVGTQELLFTMISDPKGFEKYFTELLPILIKEQNGKRYGEDDSSPVLFTLELLVNHYHIPCIMGRLKAKNIDMQKFDTTTSSFRPPTRKFWFWNCP